MNQQQQTIMAHKFQSVLDADVLNERGAQLGFCQRQRLITPFRFGLSVIASMATEQVASLADLHASSTTCGRASRPIKPSIIRC